MLLTGTLSIWCFCLQTLENELDGRDGAVPYLDALAWDYVAGGPLLRAAGAHWVDFNVRIAWAPSSARTPTLISESHPCSRCGHLHIRAFSYWCRDPPAGVGAWWVWKELNNCMTAGKALLLPFSEVSSCSVYPKTTPFWGFIYCELERTITKYKLQQCPSPWTQLFLHLCLCPGGQAYDSILTRVLEMYLAQLCVTLSA